ncbi:hypothetical protein [Mesobacillus foraminis]|nr:hypothetical protein [Mesobacillus foraminis]
MIGLFLFYMGSEIIGILLAGAAMVFFPGRKRARKPSKAKRSAHYYHGDFHHNHHREEGDGHKLGNDLNGHNDKAHDSNESAYDGGDSSGGDSGGGGGD